MSFYHLANDPFETMNLINAPSREKEQMRDTLQQYYSRLLSESNFSYQTDIKPKYIKTLKSLGYL